MLKCTKVIFIIICCSLTINQIHAEPQTYAPFIVTGTTTHTIPIETIPISAQTTPEELMGLKTISLMKISPSEEMNANNILSRQHMVLAGGENDYSNGIIPFSSSPGAVDLGMNNVPVLDQGAYGTCVTFSATAALDALLKVGDYIDQQCTLAFLKSFLQDYWNGASNPTQIFSPLSTYGIIPKGSCFGVNYPNPNQVVYLWKYLPKSNKKYSKLIHYNYASGSGADSVKQSLKSGSRVLIGMALAATDDPISVEGFDISVAGVKHKGGLWACKQNGNSFDYCSKQNAGHEIVVIGYDDNQKLFKIRNSWTSAVGDQGDFYITYEFFNAMVGDHTSLY